MRKLFLICLLVACSSSKPAGPAPYTLAVVYNGSEVWIGNDLNSATPEGETKIVGAWPALVGAFKKVDLGRVAPAGSTGMLVEAATNVEVRVPMGPIAKLDASAFGKQEDYASKIASELVLGAQLAIDELAKTTASKKILLVIGDGNDTNPEAAVGQLEALAKRASTQGIEVHAIVYKGMLSADTTGVTSLTPNVRTASTQQALELELVRTLENLGK